MPVYHLKTLFSSRVIFISDLSVQKLEASSFAVHPTFRTDEGGEGGWRLSGNSCGWCCSRCLCWLLNPCLTQDPVQVVLSPVFIICLCLLDSKRPGISCGEANFTARCGTKGNNAMLSPLGAWRKHSGKTIILSFAIIMGFVHDFSKFSGYLDWLHHWQSHRPSQ